MKRITIALGAVLAWVCGVFGATHEGVQLWENGPLWAKTNIGANSPTEAGYYFWWSDTIGYRRVDNKWVATDGSSSSFSFSSSNSPTYNKNIATLKSQGWITDDSVLAPEHDAAHVHWGGARRMPTMQELDDLVSKCVWTSLYDPGSCGCYWSSVPTSDTYLRAMSLSIRSSGHDSCYDIRYYGRPVRPVQNSAEE